jgi:hypothetical protein
MQKPRRLTGCCRRKCVSTFAQRVGTSGPLVRSPTNGRASRASLPKSANSKPVTIRAYERGRPCPWTNRSQPRPAQRYLLPSSSIRGLSFPRLRTPRPPRSFTATTIPPRRARIPGAPRLPDTTPPSWRHRLVMTPAFSNARSPLWFLRLHLPFSAPPHVLLQHAFSSGQANNDHAPPAIGSSPDRSPPRTRAMLYGQ